MGVVLARQLEVKCATYSVYSRSFPLPSARPRSPPNLPPPLKTHSLTRRLLSGCARSRRRRRERWRCSAKERQCGCTSARRDGAASLSRGSPAMCSRSSSPRSRSQLPRAVDTLIHRGSGCRHPRGRRMVSRRLGLRRSVGTGRSASVRVDEGRVRIMGESRSGCEKCSPVICQSRRTLLIQSGDPRISSSGKSFVETSAVGKKDRDVGGNGDGNDNAEDHLTTGQESSGGLRSVKSRTVEGQEALF
jgi:hypothetical protein